MMIKHGTIQNHSTFKYKNKAHPGLESYADFTNVQRNLQQSLNISNITIHFFDGSVHTFLGPNPICFPTTTTNALVPKTGVLYPARGGGDWEASEEKRELYLLFPS